MPREPESPFAFLRNASRDVKPRERGRTTIRGPYYSMLGARYLEDVLDQFGAWVDALKFAGGSFVAMPAIALARIVETCHSHDVEVSTGGFVERVLLQGRDAVDRYVDACRASGFDFVEISSGFVTIPEDDVIALVQRVRDEGLDAIGEVNVQPGAGGDSPAEELEREGAVAVDRALRIAQKALDAGAREIVLESEGVTENVTERRTDVPHRVMDAIGPERVTFEAADPREFGWYVKTFGPDVNLFVDHSQIAQLELLRQGLWGPVTTWGRVASYRQSG